MKKIVIPYYFEFNNQKVLDSIENIRIYLFEPININFLNTILSCKNLKTLHLIFMLPFQNYQIIHTVFQNIGNIPIIEIETVAHVTLEDEENEE